MFKVVLPAKARSADQEKIVVLLVPEALEGAADAEKLRATFASPSAPVRLLVCLAERVDDWLIKLLPELGVKAEILLAPELEKPTTSATVLQALPKMLPRDQLEFALALSDVVLRTPGSTHPVAITAQELAKPLIAPGEAVPPLPPLFDIIHRLDPNRPGVHSLGHCGFGRLEQGLGELFAFDWLGGRKGIADSCKRLRKCLGAKWHPNPYFAPDKWRELEPDKRGGDENAEMVVLFDELDRSALYGSYIHRDFLWIEHFGAAFAVATAVSGHLSGAPGKWGGVELITLAVVAGLVIFSRVTRLQDRWTACRLGAEQLRIARLSLPLLVLPSALATADKPETTHHRGNEPDFGFMALAQVKRAIRDHGLPQLVEGFSLARALAWVRLIVRDQIDYHKKNHHKLHRAEDRLRRFAIAIFVAAFFAVILHFHFKNADWLLLVTAAGPAFAAALHGVGTRLGIVHRAALSREVERQLTKIDNDLDELGKAAGHSVDEAEAWAQVRRLTFQAAEAMGRENTSWHGLVRRYRDDL
jgi:hypothetical protein